MPRKSSAAMALPPMDGRPVTRLQPPDDMDATAAAVFRRITAVCDPSHFVAADMEILRTYVQAAVQADAAYEHMRKHGRVVAGKPSPWLAVQEKSTRVLQILAPRLRLGPRTRVGRKRAARTTGAKPSIYSLMETGHA